MFSHILWILGKEKKLLATPLTSLIPTNGTVIWETVLILRGYSNIMGATAVGGYYWLCGLQGETKTWATVRLLEGMKASSFSLFLFSSSSSSLLSQPKYNSTGTSKWGYTAMPTFSSPPPWETREAGFPLCHFSFENSLHCAGHSVFPAMVAGEGTASQTSPGAVGGRRRTAARAMSCFEEEGNGRPASSQQRWALRPYGALSGSPFNSGECPQLAHRTRC